jgi:hypothetical protein
MSRSIKKTPVCGITTAESEKKDKQRASRATRRVNYTATKAPIELLEDFAPISNLQINGHGDCHFSKDGRQYVETKNSKITRK